MSNISKGYEQFKKVDAELDKLLLYIEKLEEEYAKAVSGFAIGEKRNKGMPMQVLKTSEVVAGLMKLGDILDKIEMGEEENRYYTNVIWYAIDMITIEKETIK
tara:strand:+ start:295 stop:603 length:309 start_codon:yes stop_codon:yes gene_type:complete